MQGQIDWTDLNYLITEHFSVKDALWLDHWTRLANESDGLTEGFYSELLETCLMAEDLRAILGVPLEVTSMFRPPGYSVLVGGSSTDPHTLGIAIDFKPIGLSTDQAKIILLPILEKLGIRMENNGQRSSWVHCDRAPVVHNRYFLP